MSFGAISFRSLNRTTVRGHRGHLGWGISANRRHRSMAGLTMGNMQVLNLVIGGYRCRGDRGTCGSRGRLCRRSRSGRGGKSGMVRGVRAPEGRVSREKGCAASGLAKPVDGTAPCLRLSAIPSGQFMSDRRSSKFLMSWAPSARVMTAPGAKVPSARPRIRPAARACRTASKAQALI
mgnify:CR=1 FL=1